MEEKEILQQILESTKKNEAYAKKQFIVNLIRSIASVLMLIVVLVFVVMVSSKVTVLTAEASATLQSIDTTMKSADEVARELKSVDVGGTMSSMNEFLGTAYEKIDAFDIDGLNKAIADLEATVAPLAKLFGRK